MTNLERIEYRLERIEQLIKEKPSSSRWLSLREAAAYSSLSQSTLRRLVIKGKLKCSRQCGKLLFRIQWVDSYLQFGKLKLTSKEHKELPQ